MHAKKIERCLGIEVDDTLAIAEQVDLSGSEFRHRALRKVGDPMPACAGNFQSTFGLTTHTMLYVLTDAFSKVSHPASRFEPFRAVSSK